MSRDDREYLEDRAEQEIALAQAADDVRIVQVHYEMATAYLDRLYTSEEDGIDGTGEG